jgi:hypothetical protein
LEKDLNTESNNVSDDDFHEEMEDLPESNLANKIRSNQNLHDERRRFLKEINPKTISKKKNLKRNLKK